MFDMIFTHCICCLAPSSCSWVAWGIVVCINSNHSNHSNHNANDSVSISIRVSMSATIINTITITVGLFVLLSLLFQQWHGQSECGRSKSHTNHHFLEPMAPLSLPRGALLHQGHLAALCQLSAKPDRSSGFANCSASRPVGAWWPLVN